ncbi:hypothetical protein IWX75_003201 [Arthrobacter sp. CAN_A6]|uniref:heparinase II/III family protein n=1 Tax=Arthrobacter sp. CAN_A6 TaxID=2787721 RepID=UPI0018C8E087
MFTTDQLPALRAAVTAQLPRVANDAARKRATKFLSLRIVSSASFPDVAFDGGALWVEKGTRGQQRYLHGLLFLTDWFETILSDTATSVEAATSALSIVETWANLHVDPQTSPSMAYHDETTAQRLINLISLHPILIEHDPDKTRTVIEPLMADTAALLARESFHAAGNNHGMFQDLALLYWTIMSSSQNDSQREEYFEKAMTRLKRYFSSCFTADGVHVENTPTYHLMVSRHVSNVQKIAHEAGHPDAEYYVSLVQRAERYATHALMPDGTFPPISDTQQTNVGRSGMQKVFPGEGFAFASSGGALGSAPADRCLVLPDSGYAIYRSEWGNPDAAYAFFSAAYNADYHKHSDDLSFFLRSDGIDLLSESGPYGYDYKHPFSRYAYSQFAHNSLVVDGQSLPRTDGKQGKVTLRAVEEHRDGFTVIGTNARYEDVVHERTVEVTEDAGVPRFGLTDSISSDGEHEYQLLWNLGTEVDVTLHGQGFELFHQNRKVMDLMITADVPTVLSLHEGVEKPRPLGWRFPKFGEAQPAKVVVISFKGSSVRLDTRIRLADFSYADRGLSAPDQQWSRYRGEVPLNYLFTPGKSAAGRRRLTVVFSAIQEPGDFTYNYKATVDEVDISALYILDDFGDQGAYYHSDHRSDTIFRSVQSLIKAVAEKHGLALSDIVTVGSSKGGTAALIHGCALPAGMIIAGAPQTRIGSFVSGPHPNILQFMAGGVGDGDVAHLDRLVDDIAGKADDGSRISILVGQNDHHLPNHVQPLLESMSTNGVTRPAVTVLPNLSHSDIGSVFRFFLAANLEQWVSGSSEEALPYILSADVDARSIRIKVYAPAGTQISYRLFQGSDLVRRRSYSDRQVVVFDDLSPGAYRVRVFKLDGDSTEATAFTTRWIKVT